MALSVRCSENSLMVLVTGYNAPTSNISPPGGDLLSTNLTPDTFQSAPDSYGSPQAAPDSYGSPLRSVLGSQDTYGSPSNTPIGASDSLGSPISATDSYGPVGATLVVGEQATDSYGSPIIGTVENVGNVGPDSYGTPLGTPIGSSQTQDGYGSPQAAAPNTYVSPNAQDSYGSPINQGFAPGFQANQNNYGSPLTNLFQAPDVYGSPQFSGNPDPDVSIATIRVVDPPGSNAGAGDNPFLGRSTQPYQSGNLLAAQSQPVPSAPSSFPNNNNNRFTPEFIPSMRLPDNFVPSLDGMVIQTTERFDLLKKMKFPSDDQGLQDYVETNQLVRNQGDSPQLSAKETEDVEIIGSQSTPSTPFNPFDESEYEDEEEEDDEEYEDVQIGVGKMGKPVEPEKPAEPVKPVEPVRPVEPVKPVQPAKSTSRQPKRQREQVNAPVKTDEGLDDKTLEKVLENILAEVEQGPIQ